MRPATTLLAAKGFILSSYSINNHMAMLCPKQVSLINLSSLGNNTIWLILYESHRINSDKHVENFNNKHSENLNISSGKGTDIQNAF